MATTLLRTQIYLPKELRREIDKNRNGNGESLSEFLRNAAVERLKKQQKKKTDLQALADRVVGSIKPGKGGWGDIKDTYKYIRKIRQEDDEHWLTRWDETVNAKSKTKKRGK